MTLPQPAVRFAVPRFHPGDCYAVAVFHSPFRLKCLGRVSWAGRYNRWVRTVVAGLIAVAVAFTVVLGLGFRLRPSFPSVSDDTFGLIAGLSIGAVSWLLVCVFLRISPWKPVVELIDVIVAGPSYWRRASRTPRPLPRVRVPSAAHLAYAADVNKTA